MKKKRFIAIGLIVVLLLFCFGVIYYAKGMFYAYKVAAAFYKGNHDQMISCCNKAIELNPKYPEIFWFYYNRGFAYHGKGNLDQAISDYTKTIELNPEYVEAYYSRG
ncbi:MAG: tetratricopeptide repeat protein, partial [Candidatus Saelkia tenebricola]|nr:tetratricopeptide repeat protein [Candidatus Saelkia tenebricola]